MIYDISLRTKQYILVQKTCNLLYQVMQSDVMFLTFPNVLKCIEESLVTLKAVPTYT